MGRRKLIATRSEGRGFSDFGKSGDRKTVVKRDVGVRFIGLLTIRLWETKMRRFCSHCLAALVYTSQLGIVTVSATCTSENGDHSNDAIANALLCFVDAVGAGRGPSPSDACGSGRYREDLRTIAESNSATSSVHHAQHVLETDQ